jgi:hypothetical protein
MSHKFDTPTATSQIACFRKASIAESELSWSEHPSCCKMKNTVTKQDQRDQTYTNRSTYLGDRGISRPKQSLEQEERAIISVSRPNINALDNIETSQPLAE